MNLMQRLLATTALLLPAAGAAAAQSAPQTAEAAVTQDAAEYAKRYGVEEAEAIARLRTLEASVPATDRIRAEFGTRLAGLAIEHAPDLRAVVLLTGDTPVPPRVIAGPVPLPVEFRTGALVTREAVVMAMTVHQATLRASLIRPPAIGLDERTGEMVVYVSNADLRREGQEALTARIAALARVPVRVELAAGTPKNAALLGGGRVVGRPDPAGPRYICTTGFAVGDGVRSGVTTAAHCPDALSYTASDGTATPLDFAGQWGWGYRDVQVNTASEVPQPSIFADTAKTVIRPITAQRSRASTRAGDFVCHRGERTGYSCAEVLMTDFAPGGDLCGGDCLPTWVAVAGPGCGGGDSGSPVFAGTVALGILKGGTYRSDGSCVLYSYMAIDYLPEPWRLLFSR